MIGNDIIDRAQARRASNWQRKGFLDKLFTTEEQRLIQSASAPDAMVWLLWSMKESAYKLVVRETGRRFFSPTKLICQLDIFKSESIGGRVFYGHPYQTTSSITEQYISTVAYSTNPFQAYTHAVIPFERTDYQYQHQLIRETLKQHYAARFSIVESRLQIQKNAVDVPTLVINDAFGRIIERPVSLSHHGNYGAFVITEPNP